MADLGYVKAQLNRVEDRNVRAALDAIFTHLLQNLRLGVPEHQTRATNMQLYWMQSTTASDTGEFSIAHGLPGTPHYAIPVLELDRYGELLFAGGFENITAYDKLYPHVAENSDAVVEFTSGTLLIPYMERLPQDLQAQFMQHFSQRVREYFPGSPAFYTFKRTLFAGRREER